MVWAELNFFFKIFRYLSQELLHKYLQFCFFFFWSPILPWRGPQRRSLFYPKGSLCSPSKTVSSAEAPFYVPFWEVSQSLDKFFLRNHFWFNEGGGGPKNEQKLVVCYITFLCFETPKASPILPQNHFAFFTSLLRNNQQFIQVYSETGNNESNSERLLNVHWTI